MVAKVKSLLTPTKPARTTPIATEMVEAIDYGHRIVEIIDETGAKDYIYQPLMQDDFLDPQEGDHFVQGTRHEKDVGDIASIFRYLHRAHPNFTVYSDLKIIWEIPGLSQPAPDVAIIPHVAEPDRPRRSFDVSEEGTRPRFVLEMVSPNYVEPDYGRKPDIYERVGVEEYIIVDSGLRIRDNTLSYTVTGYRLRGNRYVAIVPDARGWIYSEVNRVWIAPNEARDDFIVVDAQTGERIIPDRDARLTAEEQAAAEAAARLAAEEQVEAEVAARLAAEEQAATEAAARAAVEQQMREMEAEMAKLRAQLGQQ